MTSSITNRLKTEELAVFCEQLALLMNGGVSVYDGIYLIASEAAPGRDKDILVALNNSISNNIPLYEAMESTGAFPEYIVHVISVGERTGHLEEVFRSLAVYYERESRLKSRIRSAVTYPLILFAIIACIMGVLVIKILPMFERMFAELESGVSETTGNSVAAGLMAGRVAASIVAIILVILLIFSMIALTRPGRRLIHRLYTSFGPTAKLSRLAATSRLVSSISMMRSSGMDICDGLEREELACEDPTVKAKLHECIELYNSQNTLDESITKSGIIIGMDARLLSVAAKTGEDDDAYKRIAERYDEQISDYVTKLTTITETTLVISLTAMVAAVLIAIMVPLANLIAMVG